MRKLVAGSVGVVATVVVLAVSFPAPGVAAASADAPSARPAMSEKPAPEKPASEKPAPERSGLLAAPSTSPAAQVVSPPKIPPFDVAVLATGVRASRVMGKAVRSEAGDDIGTVNDVIINPPDNVAYAIVGVGGFLGVGERLVAVPFDSLQPREAGNGLVLPGATKDSIKLLPEFKYPPRPDRPAN